MKDAALEGEARAFKMFLVQELCPCTVSVTHGTRSTGQGVGCEVASIMWTAWVERGMWRRL